MARASIELVSPHKVFGRVVLGSLVVIAAFLLNLDGNTRAIVAIAGMVLIALGWNAVKDPRAAIRYAANPWKNVVGLIREWKPEGFRLEVEYEKSLHNYLKERLPFVKVTRQYGSARVKWDIGVGKDVMIEIKVGLKSTQKLQRLIGQIELFQRELEKPLIVLLLGDTQEDLLRELHHTARQYEDVRILTKEAKNLTEKNEDGLPETKAAGGVPWRSSH
jgi:hypothetical protein